MMVVIMTECRGKERRRCCSSRPIDLGYRLVTESVCFSWLASAQSSPSRRFMLFLRSLESTLEEQEPGKQSMKMSSPSVRIIVEA